MLGKCLSCLSHDIILMSSLLPRTSCPLVVNDTLMLESPLSAFVGTPSGSQAHA